MILRLKRLWILLKNNKIECIKYAAQLFVLLVVVKYFIMMTRPVWEIAKYSHPTLDDYWMSLAVSRRWSETHSIWAVFIEAFKYAVGIYRTWDGNFLSMLLTSISPIIFGESAYSFTFYFMYITFFIGTSMATYGLLIRRWHMPVINSISIMLLFIIFFMNYLPDAGEGLYWWPGVANYTFFFGMFMFAQGLYAIYWEKEKPVWLVLSSICLFLVGLGNPYTSLVSVCLTVYELAYHIYVKKSVKTLRWIPFVCALLGLIIIVVAPGNKERVQFGTLGIVETIKLSFYEGAIMLRAITKPAVCIYYAIVAVISIWSFYSVDTFRYRKRFILAPVVAILMMCLYFASFAPTKYTMTNYYSRILDTNYFISLMVITVIIIYVCGALTSWFKDKCDVPLFNIVFAVAACLFVFIGWRKLKLGEHYNLSTAFRAAGAIQFETAQEFDRNLNERYIHLTTSKDWTVYITEPPYIPVFVHDDRSSLSVIGDYYGKNVIIIE